MNDLSDSTRMKLIAVLKETDPPCEVFKCSRYQECKDQFMACKAFANYVDTGIVQNPDEVDPYHPTRDQYKKIYRHA